MNRSFKRQLQKSVHRSVLSDLQTQKNLKKGRPQEPILSSRFTSPCFTSPVQSTKYRMLFFLQIRTSNYFREQNRHDASEQHVSLFTQ